MTRIRHWLPESRAWRRASALLLLLLLLGLACGKDELTGVGRSLRTPPDSLKVLELTAVVTGSVYDVPISLGKSPTGQIGRQGPYTAHVLYDFRVPFFVVDAGDTLALQSGDLVVSLVGRTGPPFTGEVRVALREVAPAARSWADTNTTVITELPELLAGSPAPADTVACDSLLGCDTSLRFAVDLAALADYDSVVARGDTLLNVNVALVFDGFLTGGPGFVEYTHSIATGAAGHFDGAYNQPGSITEPLVRSTSPSKYGRRTVVEFDSTYSPGSNLVVSDGHRLHSYLDFGGVNGVLPDSAFVHRAELVLVQATRPDTIFGTAPELAAIVPSDSVLTDPARIYSEAENNRSTVFTIDFAPLPETEVAIDVTSYLFDQQERKVVNRGMILGLTNEGTRARHFEFHGGFDPDPAKRPRLRMIYGTPPNFGDGAP